MFYAAGGGEEYGEIAFRNLTWMAYHTDDDGCPGEITGFYGRLRRAGWQTDSHCDKLINFADAFAVLPEWAEAKDFPAQAAVEDGQGRLADLSQGVIVVPEDSGILAKAADMLSDEIERRTGVRLPQAPEQPVDARPAIVLGAAAQPGGAAPPAGLVVPDKADGYALWVDSARPEAPVVHLRGHDPRGTCSRGPVLRIGELDAGKVAVAAGLRNPPRRHTRYAATSSDTGTRPMLSTHGKRPSSSNICATWSFSALTPWSSPRRFIPTSPRGLLCPRPRGK